MIITIGNGWEDESSESPYTSVFQTKYNWETKDYWSVCLYHGKKLFIISKNYKEVGSASTLEDAKKQVDLLFNQ